ncbi:hypothetical protein [Streptomyces virginiae]|uniref:hypothetical protein n=1 Tax=Streptomyces virginiae TaxID=1961 RepID=UPI00332987F1
MRGSRQQAAGSRQHIDGTAPCLLSSSVARATVTEAARHLPDHIWRSLRPEPV